jgi:hypothetical protein
MDGSGGGPETGFDGAGTGLETVFGFLAARLTEAAFTGGFCVDFDAMDAAACLTAGFLTDFDEPAVDLTAALDAAVFFEPALFSIIIPPCISKSHSIVTRSKLFHIIFS